MKWPEWAFGVLILGALGFVVMILSLGLTAALVTIGLAIVLDAVVNWAADHYDHWSGK